MPANATTIADFNKPFLFAFSDWKNPNTAVKNGVLTIQSKSGRGGLGGALQLDLSGQTELSPVMKLKVGANHKAKSLGLTLKDGKNGGSSWNYALDKLPVGQTVTIYPEGGASLGAPSKTDDKGAADLSDIAQWQVLGNYRGDAFDVQIEAIALAPPTPDQLAARRRARA